MVVVNGVGLSHATEEFVYHRAVIVARKFRSAISFVHTCHHPIACSVHFHEA